MVQMRMEGFKKVKPTDDTERVIEKDDSNSSMTTEYDDTKSYPIVCRERLSHVLNTNKFQIVVICFVVFDGLLVIAELLINLKVLELHAQSTVPHVLHFISIGILSLFIIEIALKIFSMRLDYFRSKMEVFDAIVVILTFALNVAFSTKESFHSSIGLLVLLRLWRIAKILNGIILSVKVQAERRLRHERRTREAIEQELAKFRQYCASQEKEIATLHAVLRKHGISYGATERPVVAETISVVAEVNSMIISDGMMDLQIDDPSQRV